MTFFNFKSENINIILISLPELKMSYMLYFLMYVGEISAIIASFFWATGATFFTLAVTNIGPYRLNLIRLNLAFLFLLLVLFITKVRLFPYNATAENILWLSISGIIGLVIGDLCYFGALKYLGVRVTMLFFTLAPPAAALSEWIILKEAISAGAIIGMLIVIVGIVVVIVQKEKEKGIISYPPIGVLLGILAALFQGLGLTISKFGLKGLDAIESTYLRMLAADLSFTILYVLFKNSLPSYENRSGRIVYVFAFFGAFFGPFLGVILSMNAIRYTYSGIVQTLLSMTPITIIPFSIFVFKEKIGLKSIIGTGIALIGVLILIWLK